jgi:hypothetical protein
MSDPHSSDHFPIIISISLINHSSSRNTTPNVSTDPTVPNQFNLIKADWNLFSDIINRNITSVDNTSCPVKAYNQFTQIIIDSAKLSIQPKHKNNNLYPPSPPW